MRLALVSACTALALAAAGCGAGSEVPQAIPGASEQLLTAAAVARYSADSPEHALLAWWRIAQFDDGLAFRAALAPPLRSRFESDPGFGDDLNFFAGSIRNAAPKVVNTEIDGDRARVFTIITYRSPVGTTRFVTYSRPQAFELVRWRKRWLLADDSFVQSTLRQQAGR